MRNLDFKVSGQKLEAVGDFSNLVPGTEGYLYANFTFSDEWIGYVKVASFLDRHGKEYAVPIFNNRCEIPKEVLMDRSFRMRVIIANRDTQVPTNMIKIKQEG